MKKSEDVANLKGKKWLKKELRSFRPFIIFLTFLNVFTVLLSLAFAYLTKYLVNSAANKDTKLVIIFSSVLIGILLLRIVLRVIGSYCSERGRVKITIKLRNKLFNKILRSDFKQVEKFHSGDLLKRLTSEVTEIAHDTISIMPFVVGIIVQCAGAILALLTLDPLFTAIFVAGGIIVSGLMTLFKKRIQKLHKDVSMADGKTRSFIQESIVSSLTLKAYGAEDKTTDKSLMLLKDYGKKRMKRNVFNIIMSAGMSTITTFGFIFALVWCSVGIMKDGTSDFGSVLSIIMMLGQLQQPFTSFSSIMPVIYARNASAELLSEIDELKAEESGLKDMNGVYEKLISIKGDNLTFDYGREKLFSKAFVEINKGDVVCITGGSGCGKSTLFKLILNVYTQESGNLYLHCEEGDIPLTSAERGLFAYVPQGNFLFSGSIRENLLFFAENKYGEECEEKIKDALNEACANFVWNLPEKLDTPLHERGGGLSEGQLQRLAIARALLSERPILLLDEATSALDGETEGQLLKNIREDRDKTCIIVTHRPAALEIADDILRVDHGKIFRVSKGEILDLIEPN